MKKIISTVLALTVTASLAACGAKEPTAETPAPDPTEAPMAQMHNPIHYGTAEQVAADTGFLLTAPEGASDVQYSSIEGDPATAQMSFALNGNSCVYRVVADDTKEDISGLYYAWNNERKPRSAAVPQSCSGTTVSRDISPGPPRAPGTISPWTAAHPSRS